MVDPVDQPAGWYAESDDLRHLLQVADAVWHSRIDQILELAVRDEEFQPPPDFDLAGYWRRYQADFLAHLYRGEAVVRLAPHAASCLSGVVARALADTGTAEPDGWIRAVLPIESLDHAYSAFLALGTDVEVLEPPELRARLAETSRTLAIRYGPARPN